MNARFPVPGTIMRWLRSSHMRFIGLILLLELLFGAALLVSVTQLVRADLDAADRSVVVDARNSLLAIGRDEGEAPLSRAIDERAMDEPDAVILLATREGKRIAGNLTSWPPNITNGARWGRAELYRIDDPHPAPYGITAVQLPDGRRLLVGKRTNYSDQIRETVEQALLTALVMALPLALLGAWFVVHIIDRRISKIATAAAGVRAGNIEQRVPLDGSGDSFDRLGGAINAMLDRIGELIAELRTVTDSIAHDLRSPLTRMRARIDRAIDAEDRTAMAAAMEGISHEADQLLAMLGTALEISRMEAGIGRDRFQQIDLGEMMDGIRELYTPLVEDRGRTLTIDARQQLSTAIHYELLGQALCNLIDNSLKYGAGAMTLYLEAEGQTTIIGVSDEGTGIPPEREAEALRRFGRLDSARGQAGAGLGLTLVAAVARMHGGGVRFTRRNGAFAVAITISPAT